MINWHKLQPLYEKKAYRIVQKHIKLILSKIPVDNTNLHNYETVIALNIHEADVKKMFVEIYSTIGLSYGNKVNNELEKTKKANILFNEYLLRQILVFLSTDGGVKITSVRDTLVGDVIKSIKDTIGENATVIDLQNAIYALISKSQTFYKWQALRIARTETTSASNFAGIETAKASDLVLDKVWISVQDDRTRRTPFDHLDMNNVTQELDKPFFVGGENIQYPGDTHSSPGNVINCYLPGTTISTKILSGQKSFYSGKAVEIITRNGKRLSVTPNHYILTKNGFIKAKDINVGDNLVTNKVNSNRVVRLVNNYIDKKFFRVENVFSSLKYFWLSKQVMSRSLDFDKDGEFMKGNIDIVYPEIELIDSYKSFVDKGVNNFSFIYSFSRSIFKGRFSPFNFFSCRNIPTFTRLMSFLYLTFPSCFVHFRPLKSFALGLGSSINIERFKTSSQGYSGDSEFILELIKTHSGIIEFDDVVNVRDFEFSGHVYDFKSYSGVNITNNIYTSNCRCTIAFQPRRDKDGLVILKTDL